MKKTLLMGLGIIVLEVVLGLPELPNTKNDHRKYPEYLTNSDNYSNTSVIPLPSPTPEDVPTATGDKWKT
jgi:hypothetical protein